MDKRVIAAGAILSLMAAALVVAPGIVKRGAIARCNDEMRAVLVAIYGPDAEPDGSEADLQRLRSHSERPSAAVAECIEPLASEEGFDASLHRRLEEADQRWLELQRGGD